FHRRELRELDEAAAWHTAEAVNHAVDLLFPQRFSKPNAKFLDNQPAPARGEEVTQLMNDDHEIEDYEDFDTDADDFEDLEHWKNGLAASAEQFACPVTGPRIGIEDST